MKSNDLGRAPIEARGKTYWLSHHAADRALDMDVPIKIIQHILAHGKRHDAPPGSKYQGAEVYRMGHVSVVAMPKPEGPTIVSVLWATVEAWRAAEHRAGREYRGDEWTERTLSQWLGADIHAPFARKRDPFAEAAKDTRKVDSRMISEMPNGAPRPRRRTRATNPATRRSA